MALQADSYCKAADYHYNHQSIEAVQRCQWNPVDPKHADIAALGAWTLETTPLKLWDAPRVIGKANRRWSTDSWQITADYDYDCHTELAGDRSAAAHVSFLPNPSAPDGSQWGTSQWIPHCQPSSRHPFQTAPWLAYDNIVAEKLRRQGSMKPPRRVTVLL